MDTPANADMEGPVTKTGATAVTYSRPSSSGDTEKEKGADYGDSDGEDMRRLARPKHTSAIYMRRRKPPLPTGKRLGDKKKLRSPAKRRCREEDFSPRQRKKRRLGIQKSIGKRSKRKRSTEGLNSRTPFFQVKTREVGVKEIQAEKRAIGQELSATRTGGIPITGPLRFPIGPLP